MSCWARAYVEMFANHDSGDNFYYNDNGEDFGAYYLLTGDGLTGLSFQFLGYGTSPDALEAQPPG